jgi:hypothetical protein
LWTFHRLTLELFIYYSSRVASSSGWTWRTSSGWRGRSSLARQGPVQQFSCSHASSSRSTIHIKWWWMSHRGSPCTHWRRKGAGASASPTRSKSGMSGAPTAWRNTRFYLRLFMKTRECATAWWFLPNVLQASKIISWVLNLAHVVRISFGPNKKFNVVILILMNFGWHQNFWHQV